MAEPFKEQYLSVLSAFDSDPTAYQFLRDDGEGGIASGVYRMAREIDRLREKCGEPNTRPDDWQEEEESEIHRKMAIALAKLKGVTAQ